MGFGGGVLIAILSFELVEEAYAHAGFAPTAIGFVVGAVVYSTANWLLSRHGAANRKRCGGCVEQPTEEAAPGSGLTLAVGALLDGIPEALIIGLSLTQSAGVSVVAVVGFFISNFPEGLSSAAGMKHAGRPPGYVLGVWTTIALLSGVAALVGYTIFGRLPGEVVAATGSVAAGGLLAMVAETMIPEAFDQAPEFIGLITVAGFLVAFLLTKLA
jgi:ZIP family zinc transporter